MAWNKHLYLLLCGCILFSCKEKAPTGTASGNPFFATPALKDISGKIENNPGDASLYFKRGILLHKMSRDTLALDDFKRAAELDSSKAEYMSAIGDLMFEHKDLENAVTWLQKALKLNPEDPKAHMKVAKMLIYLREYGQAFAHINIVLRQDAMNPEGYFLKGMIYKELKDTSRSISSFLTSLQVSPDYKEAAMQLGILYSAQKNPMALKYFDNVFRIDSTDVLPLYAKGMFYQEQQQYEQAKAEYKNCILHDRSYTDAYFSTGWILIQQDSFEKAKRQFEIVAEQDPANAVAYYNRGLCSELMGHKQDALADYKQALTFDEKYPEALEGVRRLGGK